MGDEPAAVAERGLLTVSDEVWGLAVRRAEVIGGLARSGRVGLAGVDAAAAELGVSRRQVYVLLRRWREGEGVVSDLLPGKSRPVGNNGTVVGDRPPPTGPVRSGDRGRREPVPVPDLPECLVTGGGYEWSHW